MARARPVIPGGAMAPTDFGRSVNHISTRRGRIRPTQLLLVSPRFSDLPTALKMRAEFFSCLLHSANIFLIGERTPTHMIRVTCVKCKYLPNKISSLHLSSSNATPGKNSLLHCCLLSSFNIIKAN